MTHIKCPKCGSREHTQGYGFAAGGLGGYTICECGEVLERFPDPEGQVVMPPEDEASEPVARVEE